MEGEDLGLDERLRVDEWGALMLGQEHHFRDLLHPNKGSSPSLHCTPLLNVQCILDIDEGEADGDVTQCRDRICGVIFCCTSE